MTKDAAIHAAAREILAQCGPDGVPNPHFSLSAVSHAVVLGATEEDIKAEMRRQREEA